MRWVPWPAPLLSMCACMCAQAAIMSRATARRLFRCIRAALPPAAWHRCSAGAAAVPAAAVLRHGSGATGQLLPHAVRGAPQPQPLLRVLGCVVAFRLQGEIWLEMRAGMPTPGVDSVQRRVVDRRWWCRSAHIPTWQCPHTACEHAHAFPSFTRSVQAHFWFGTYHSDHTHTHVPSSFMPRAGVLFIGWGLALAVLLVSQGAGMHQCAHAGNPIHPHPHQSMPLPDCTVPPSCIALHLQHPRVSDFTSGMVKTTPHPSRPPPLPPPHTHTSGPRGHQHHAHLPAAVHLHLRRLQHSAAHGGGPGQRGTHGAAPDILLPVPDPGMCVCVCLFVFAVECRSGTFIILYDAVSFMVVCCNASVTCLWCPSHRTQTPNHTARPHHHRRLPRLPHLPYR